MGSCSIVLESVKLLIGLGIRVIVTFGVPQHESSAHVQRAQDVSIISAEIVLASMWGRGSSSIERYLQYIYLTCAKI